MVLSEEGGFMTHWEGLNRRKFPRVNYPCLVVIRNDIGEEKDILLSHTENLGVGGVSLTIKKNLKLFSSVDLEIDLLDLGNNLKCRGKVVWNVRRKETSSRKPLFYDVGIEFVNINDVEQKRIIGIVKVLVLHNRQV